MTTDDCITMKDQEELVRLRNESRLKCHLTPNFINESADKLIAELRQKLGATEAYITELEDNFKTEKEALETELNAVKKERNLLMTRFNNGITEIYKEERFAQLLQEREDLKKRCKMLEHDRDWLIYRLSQYTNAENSGNVQPEKGTTNN